MRIELAGYSALGDRVENEDSAAFNRVPSESVAAVVCDGLGAHGGGKRASDIAVQALTPRENMKSLPTPEQITAWMNDANAEILLRRDGPQHMKTTVAALYVLNSSAIWAHIGDSRLYHYYSGELQHFTEDHSICQVLVKMGELTRRDIPAHPDRSKILRALGDDSISPEIHPKVELEPGFHAFLLCTDGLWERLNDDEIMIELHKAQDPELWLSGLRSRALMRKSTDVDNNTAIAVFITV